MTEEKIAWKESQALSQQLVNEAKPYDANTEAEISACSLYALVYEGTELGSPWSEPAPQIIYVGRGDTDSLRHFANDTAVSTVRRSLAAMLAGSRDLTPLPGSEDPEDVDRFSNYRLDQASEEKLSQWMRENLKVAALRLPGALDEATYLGLLDYATPLFNFQLNPNNLYGSQVKKYRQLMAEKAAEAVQE